MFCCEIKKENVNWFKCVIETFSEIVDEVNVEVNEKGLIFKNLDRSHVMFATLQLKKNWFKKFNFIEKPLNMYSVSPEELYNIFSKHAVQEDIDMDLFEVGILSLDIIVLRPPYAHRRYRNFMNGDIYEQYNKQKYKKDFWLDTDEFNKYIQLVDEYADIKLSDMDEQLELKSENGEVKKKFNISTVDNEYDVPGEPDLSLYTFIPKFSVFKNFIDTFKMRMHDKIYLSLKEGNLNFHGGADKNTTDLTIQNTRLDKKLEIKACYGFERICKTISKLKNVSHMTLDFNYDQPIRLRYYNTISAVFTVLIAPRIEAED